MLALLLILLLALVLFGVGFTLHFLWIAAAVIFLFWLAGFAFRSGSGRRRWYYW
ncbi:MAG: hydrophobic protein [Acidimicrobiales bacterium]